MKMRMRDWLSPDKDIGDSDMESVVSVTSSAFSTQSERPRQIRYDIFFPERKKFEQTKALIKG